MRYTTMAASVGLGLGFLIPHALGQVPLSVNPTPDSWEEVQSEVQQIPGILDGVQCGGWSNETVNGKIADVNGVPGRRHSWDTKILSGMGERIDGDGDGDKDNDFEYPESGQGLTTACQAGLDRIEKFVWRPKPGGYPGEIEQSWVNFAYPYFEDPSCRWRIEGGGNPPFPLRDNQLFNYNKIEEPNSPNTCAGFCQYANRFAYPDCASPAFTSIVVDTPDGPQEITYVECENGDWRNYFVCTDEEWNGNETCNQAAPETEWPNASTCQGDECRCPDQVGGVGDCRVSPRGLSYDSYYRYYEGSYTRDRVAAAPNDQSSKNAPVACFGFYDEFDPKDRQTNARDRRCVINIDVVDMREKQKGKGEYGQNAPPFDRDPNAAANQREGGNFDQEEDLWYQQLSGGFSVLNEKVFINDYNKDLTNVFLDIDHLDKAQMHAIEQVSPQQPLARSSTIRAFDDTGEKRTLASWWQKQQNSMAELLHPPTVRILLPAGWAFGVDPNDPFFNRQVAPSTNDLTKRTKRIEVQIDADEDTLGTALAYIDRSLLLDVREEPVPVIVPMGSATEFRAKAEAWCTWYIQISNESTCNNAPEPVLKLMARLEEYADTIDNVRLLRGELARYAGKILDLQQGLTSPISQWVLENVRRYKAVLQEQRQIRMGFAGTWRSIQEMYNDFDSKSNLPWCMNQRYTAPIFSLLDDWMPSRRDEGKTTADGLPNITSRGLEDMVIDFSTLTYMSGSVTLPVLEPVQVRLDDIPMPPAGKEHGITREYPPLPSVEAIRTQIRRAADSLQRPPQNVQVPPPIEFDLLGQQGLEDLNSTIAAIGGMIAGMNERYEKFWKSIGPLRPEEAGGGRSGIQNMKEHLECMDWDDPTCQHVEMDLLERFMRIGSRPLVLLNEDLDSRSIIRGMGGTCVDSDDVCTPVNPESAPPRHQWEIIGPRNQQDSIGEIRTNVGREGLPQPVGTIPADKYPPYGTDVNELMPVQNVPKPIDLNPPSSAPAQ